MKPFLNKKFTIDGIFFPELNVIEFNQMLMDSIGTSPFLNSKEISVYHYKSTGHTHTETRVIQKAYQYVEKPSGVIVSVPEKTETVVVEETKKIKYKAIEVEIGFPKNYYSLLLLSVVSEFTDLALDVNNISKILLKKIRIQPNDQIIQYFSNTISTKVQKELIELNFLDESSLKINKMYAFVVPYIQDLIPGIESLMKIQSNSIIDSFLKKLELLIDIPLTTAVVILLQSCSSNKIFNLISLQDKFKKMLFVFLGGSFDDSAILVAIKKAFDYLIENEIIDKIGELVIFREYFINFKNSLVWQKIKSTFSENYDTYIRHFLQASFNVLMQQLNDYPHDKNFLWNSFLLLLKHKDLKIKKDYLVNKTKMMYIGNLAYFEESYYLSFLIEGQKQTQLAINHLALNKWIILEGDTISIPLRTYQISKYYSLISKVSRLLDNSLHDLTNKNSEWFQNQVDLLSHHEILVLYTLLKKIDNCVSLEINDTTLDQKMYRKMHLDLPLILDELKELMPNDDFFSNDIDNLIKDEGLFYKKPNDKNALLPNKNLLLYLAHENIGKIFYELRCKQKNMVFKFMNSNELSIADIGLKHINKHLNSYDEIENWIWLFENSWQKYSENNKSFKKEYEIYNTNIFMHPVFKQTYTEKIAFVNWLKLLISKKLLWTNIKDWKLFEEKEIYCPENNRICFDQILSNVLYFAKEPFIEKMKKMLSNFEKPNVDFHHHKTQEESSSNDLSVLKPGTKVYDLENNCGEIVKIEKGYIDVKFDNDETISTYTINAFNDGFLKLK